MARACNHALRLPPNPVATPLPGGRIRGARRRTLAVHAQLPAEDDAAYPTEPSKKAQAAQSVRRSRRRGAGGGARQSLVSVGTARGGGDQWSGDFDLTMRQLHLDDLIEDGQRDADVLVHLLVQQHTQFGMSIKGRVLTSFRKICDSCSSPYCTNIDEKFNLTVLSSSRRDQSGLPFLGDSDPSVIYVRPGEEVDLDSVIQETIRLTASAKSSCSEACEKSTVVWQYGSNQRKKSSSQRIADRVKKVAMEMTKEVTRAANKEVAIEIVEELAKEIAKGILRRLLSIYSRNQGREPGRCDERS